MKLTDSAIILIFAIILGSCAGMESMPSKGKIGSFTASVVVTGRVLNTVKPLIFGDNIEWTNNGMGIWLPGESRFDTTLVEELRAVGITHLRYPGGTLSDYFEWHKAVGQNRQLITNPFAGMKKEYPHFGPEEFMMLCRELDIPGTITFNAGTGTPEDAARWVKYFADKNFKVTAFAVGNEIYMAKPEEPIAKTVQQYMDFYTKCKQEIDKIAPSFALDSSKHQLIEALTSTRQTKDIKLGAIGLHNSEAMPLSQNRDWLRDILNGIGDKMDFVDVHNGYAPVTRGVGLDPKERYPDDEFAECFMGASVYVQDNINLTKQDIERFAPNGGKHIELHITEYGPLVYPLNKKKAVEDVAWNRSLTGALYLACLFNVFLKEPKLTSANHLPLCQDIFGALIGIRGNYPERKTWRNVVNYVFQMYSEMSGKEVLDVKVQSPTYSTPSMGIVPKLENIPYIDTGAYREKDSLFIFLINRSVRNDASVNINTGFNSYKINQISTLTADSYKAENTPETLGNVVPVVRESDKLIHAGSYNIMLPKHSLTVISITEWLTR